MMQFKTRRDWLVAAGRLICGVLCAAVLGYLGWRSGYHLSIIPGTLGGLYIGIVFGGNSILGLVRGFIGL